MLNVNCQVEAARPGEITAVGVLSDLRPKLRSVDSLGLGPEARVPGSSSDCPWHSCRS